MPPSTNTATGVLGPDENSPSPPNATNNVTPIASGNTAVVTASNNVSPATAPVPILTNGVVNSSSGDSGVS